MFAVCVTFDIRAGQIDAFLPKMLRQAATSLRVEPDCHRFDVCQDGDTVFLYELYTDAPAFQSHLDSTHFRAFDADVAPMVASKTVKTYTRLTP